MPFCFNSQTEKANHKDVCSLLLTVTTSGNPIQQIVGWQQGGELSSLKKFLRIYLLPTLHANTATLWNSRYTTNQIQI